MKPRLWPILLASAIGIAILVGLGIWQVQRLAQKNALIAALEQRMKAEPISLESALTKLKTGEDIEYLKVKITGQQDGAHNLRKVSSVNSSPGWEIISPFKTDDGHIVLVDVGGIAENQPLASSTTTQTIEGLVRFHNKGRGYFDPDNDVTKNIWYWWDVPAMLTSAGAANDGKAASFILQKLPTENDVTPPYIQKSKVELANNHLGYAITWFGLAAALASVAGFFVASLSRKSHA